jgi:phosphoribosylglycinamide formyltransferase-1
VRPRVFPRARIPTARRATRDGRLARAHGVELVVLAGYMQLLDARLPAPLPRRVINVHPRCCRRSRASRAIEQALDYGVKVFGVTVHFVDEGVDTGRSSSSARRAPGRRRAEEVREALRPIEHDLLCEAVGLIARGAVRLDPGHPRRVLVAP